MEKLYSRIGSKKMTAIVIGFLLICYVFVTGTFAQESTLTSTNSNITYNKEHLSYGDVWALDSETHEATSYNLNGSKELSWYVNGGAGNKDTTDTPYPTNYFQTVTITEGKLDITNSIPMEKLEFAKFHAGVEDGVIASDAESTLSIPVVSVTGDTAGIYSVVPGKTGEFNVHAYVENATEDSLILNYAMLDSCADTNAYAQNGFSDSVTLTRIGETKWYRGKVQVELVTWYAASVWCEKTSVNDDNNKGNVGNGEYTGGATNLLLNGSTYYYNDWSHDKAYYNTVIVFEIPVGVSLGPISSSGNIVFSNSDDEMGSLTAQSVFGENITISSDSLNLPNMPIVLNVQAQDRNMFMNFTQSNGEDIPAYIEGGDNANTVQTVVKGSTYVYYHENNGNSITAQWAPPAVLPKITVSGDANVYDFIENRIGSVEYTKGTQSSFVFSFDFKDVTVFSSGTYTVTGDTINGVSTYTKEFNENTNSFTVPVMYDETTVQINMQDMDGRSYTFSYTLTPVITGESVVKNITSGYSYVFLEDALVEAQSGDTLVLIKDASFAAKPESDIASTKWVTENKGYTVAEGVTFLVPYSADDYSIGTETKTIDGKSNSILKNANIKLICAANEGTDVVRKGLFLSDVDVTYTLTIPSAITINVENGGKFVIGGTIVAGNRSTAGISCATSGLHSNVQLEGTLNVEGILSVCGYILGGGQVNINAGGTVYQPFTIMDFTNGPYTIRAKEDGTWPFYRYAMTNIQSDMRMVSGASMKGYVDLYTGALDIVIFKVDNRHNVTEFDLISSTGLVRLNEGASLDISYDPTCYANDTDSNHRDLGMYHRIGKTTMTFTGGMTFGSVQLTIELQGTKYPLSTDQDHFVIPYNYDIVLNEGTYTVANMLKLLPGANMIVNSKALVQVVSGSSLGIMSGLRDHRVYAATSETENWYNEHYPSTAVLQAPPFNGNGTGNLVLNGGTLQVDSQASFGGLVQTTGTGTLIMNGNSSVTARVGVLNEKNSLTGDLTGRGLYTLTAQVYGQHGERINITNGQKFHAVDNTARLYESYSYVVYTSSTSNTTTDMTQTLDATVIGTWRCDNCTGVDTDHVCDVCGYETMCIDEETPVHSCDICGKYLCESGDLIFIEAKPATCTTEGTVQYWKCSVCEKMFSDETCSSEITSVSTEIDKDNHVFGAATYAWTDDNTSCAATRSCSCGVRESVAAITVTSTGTITCKEESAVTYTATFAVDWASEQTKEVRTSAEHTYDPTTNKCTVCGIESTGIMLTGRTLRYVDKISMIHIYNIPNMTADALASPETAGLLMWEVKPTTVEYNEANVVSGLTEYVNDGITYYYGESKGIETPNLYKTYYFAAYVKVDEGYIYSDVTAYSPSTYAYNMIGKYSVDDSGKETGETSGKTHELCIALLNYISASQEYFAESKGTTPTTLVNQRLTDEQKALAQQEINWTDNESLIIVNTGTDKTVTASTDIFTESGNNLLFDQLYGLAILYKVADENVTPGDQTVSGTLIWSKNEWGEAILDVNDESSVDNRNGMYKYSKDVWYSLAPMIAPKDMKNTTYYFLGYTTINGTVHYSGATVYNVEKYIFDILNKKDTNGKLIASESMQSLAKALYYYERAANEALPGDF